MASSNVEISNDDLLEAISQKSVMDIVKLVEAMEEKFGVSAQAAAVAVAPAGAEAEAAGVAEEKSEFNVHMTGFGDNKIAVIKAVRAITGLGLKEAKELVEGVPGVVKESVPKAEAEDMKKQLEEAGATVELK